MEETREMFKLGEAVFLEGIEKLKDYKLKREDFIHKRNELIIKKRLAVVEFTHGLELILKAIMIKKGFLIYRIKNKIIRKADKISDLLDKERTIELGEVISLFRKEYPRLSCLESVEKLRKLRNQIIHKGTEIGEKKIIFFMDAIKCLDYIYKEEGIRHKKFLKQIEESKNLI